jgi:hypothetical protein
LLKKLDQPGNIGKHGVIATPPDGTTNHLKKKSFGLVTVLDQVSNPGHTMGCLRFEPRMRLHLGPIPVFETAFTRIDSSPELVQPELMQCGPCGKTVKR